MNISIIGASGFVGKNLIYSLLLNTNHNIIAIALDTEKINIEEKYKNRVKLLNTDVFDSTKLKINLAGTDVAFYLIHMLDSHGGFYNKESEAANIIGKALKDNKVKKIIYMSGLGKDSDKLSEHLASRHNTGKILNEYLPTIEFRASMIIGEGSASYEIVKDIINNAPFIILPQKSITNTQPITKKDAISYLCSAINLNIHKSIIIEIGGPVVMTYKEFLEKYNTWSNRNIPIKIIPFLSGQIAGFFLNFFTNKNRARIGQNMISSFQNEMIVTNNIALEFFPEITTERIENGFI